MKHDDDDDDEKEDEEEEEEDEEGHVFELGSGFVGIDNDGFIRVYMHGVGGTGKCRESPSSNKSD